MTITPRISLVAYEEQSWIFVMVPNEKGRYVRTDKCVAYAGCPLCGATVGEPCFVIEYSGEKRYKSGTHARRRERNNRPSNWRKFSPRRNPSHDDAVEHSYTMRGPEIIGILSELG